MKMPKVIDGVITIDGDTVVCKFPDGIQMIFDDDHYDDAVRYLTFNHSSNIMSQYPKIRNITSDCCNTYNGTFTN